MTQFSVQLPAGDTMTLDLDLATATVAAVKATVDSRLEKIWRESGVRILRSDLPFCGIVLRYKDSDLALDKILSSCGIRKGSRLHAQWPQRSEKDERRKRYGKGWGDEPGLERRRREVRKLKRVEREGKSAEKAMGGAARARSSKVEEDVIRSAAETGGDEQILTMCVSDDGPGEETEAEAEGDCADEGAQGSNEEIVVEGQEEQRVEEEGQEERSREDLSEEVANGEQDEQQVEEEVQDERPTGEVEQDDPFADDDSDKENREPVAFAPVVENRGVDDPSEEWSVFDERNSGFGMDLLEEVLDF